MNAITNNLLISNALSKFNLSKGDKQLNKIRDFVIQLKWINFIFFFHPKPLKGLSEETT